MPDSLLILLRALTPLHPGAGTSVGVIDMPIQREAHTLWPMIQATTLKGKLRDLCRLALVSGKMATDRPSADKYPDLEAVFGPAIGAGASGSSIFGGALTVQDARMLAFPVRSARGVYAWVTCPYLLGRLLDDLVVFPKAKVCGGHTLVQMHLGSDEQFISTTDAANMLMVGDVIVIEDYVLRRADTERNEIDAVAGWFSAATGARGIKERLIVVHDDVFTHLVRFATNVVTRNKLDSQTKRVEQGALFNIELLPVETLMYSLAMAEDARGSKRMSGADVILAVKSLVAPTGVGPLRAQIGGDETTGKGWCEFRAVA